MNDEPPDMSTEQSGKKEGLAEGLSLTPFTVASTSTSTSTTTDQWQSESARVMQQPQHDLSQSLSVVEGKSTETSVSSAFHSPPLEVVPPNASGSSTIQQEIQQEIQQILSNYRPVQGSLGVDATMQENASDPQRSSMSKEFDSAGNLDIQSSTASHPQQNMSDPEDMDHVTRLPTQVISLSSGAVVQPLLEIPQALADDTNSMMVRSNGTQNANSEQDIVHQLPENHTTTESIDDAASWDSWDSSPDEEETDKPIAKNFGVPQHQPTEQPLEPPNASVQNIARTEKIEGESQTVDAVEVAQPHNVFVDDETNKPLLQYRNSPQMVAEARPEDIVAPHRSSSTTLSSIVETEAIIPPSLESAMENASGPTGPSAAGTIPSTIQATGRKHIKKSRRKSSHTMVEDHLEDFHQSFARKRHRSPPRVLGILLVTLILAFGSIAYSQVRLLRSTKKTTHRRGGSQAKVMGKNKARKPDTPWLKRIGSSATPPKREEHVFQKVYRKDKPIDPPIIVVGLPKAGTSSLFQYFNCFGYWSQHWYCCGRQMNAQNPGAGQMQMMSDCIASNLAKNLSMFDGCGDFEVYAEINGPRRDPQTNKLWGSIRPRILLPQHYYLPQLYDAAPNATWVLNLRPVKDWIASVANIPGNTLALQFFNEGKAQEPERWQGKFVDRKFLAAFWSAHIKRVREFAKSHPTIRLIEIDITDENAGIKLARQMGWIGNSTTRHPFPKAGALSTKNITSPETIEAWANKCWGAHNVKQHADFKNTKKTSNK